MGKMIQYLGGKARRKILIVTFIPFFAWLIAGVLFYLYSEGIVPQLLGKLSQDVTFPLWAFLVVTLPLGVGSMIICYIIMVARELNRSSNDNIWTVKR